MVKKYVFGIFGIVTLVCTYSFSNDISSKNKLQETNEVYTMYCQNCHMADGKGLEGTYPSIIKSGFLTDPKKAINIILKGQSGEIVVNGVKFNAIMPAQDYLTDDQIASVLSFVRNNFGNKGSKITPAQVKALR